MADYNFYDYNFNKSVRIAKIFTETYYLNSYYNGSKEFYDFSFGANIESCNPNPKGNSSDLVITFPYTCNFYGNTSINSSVLYPSCTVYVLIQDDLYNTIEERTTNHVAGYYEITEAFNINHGSLSSNRYINITLKITVDNKSQSRQTSLQLNVVPSIPQIECGVNPGSFYPDITIGEKFQIRITSNIAMDYRYAVSYKVAVDDGLIYHSDLALYTPGTVSKLFEKEFTLPVSLMDAITKSKFARVVFECDTYAIGKDRNGNSSGHYSEYLGKSTFSFDAQIAPSWKPEIINLLVTPVYTIDNILVQDGEFIEDVSKPNFKITTKTHRGATIESYKIHRCFVVASYPNPSMNNFSYQQASLIASGVTDTTEKQNALSTTGITANILTERGYYVFYATVTDSRGFTSNVFSTSKFYEVIRRDLITGDFSAYRCDSNNLYDEEGTRIRCTCNATIQLIKPDGLNTYVELYARKSDGSYEYVDSNFVNAVKSGDSVLIGETFNFEGIDPKIYAQTDYKAEFIIKYGNETYKITRLIPSADVLIDIAPNGSVGVGTKANDNAIILDIAMNTRPSVSNTYDLGSSSNKWKTIYSHTALNTSDRQFKENINYVNQSNKTRNNDQISQEDLHNFYKSDYMLATYNYIGQPQTEYGFITQDMYNNNVGESLIIKSEHGDMFSINSYVSSIAGALQYEINLRDAQINELMEVITTLQNEINNLKK